MRFQRPTIRPRADNSPLIGRFFEAVTGRFRFPHFGFLRLWLHSEQGRNRFLKFQGDGNRSVIRTGSDGARSHASRIIQTEFSKPKNPFPPYNSAIMPIQFHQFCCPNPRCSDRTVLPRQSPLGKFDGQPSPSKDIWPIKYLCRACGQSSEIPDEAIHPKVAENTDRNQLFQYVFSNGQPDSVVRIWIYCKENQFFAAGHTTAQEAIQNVLLPSGFWRDFDGSPKFVGIEPLPF